MMIRRFTQLLGTGAPRACLYVSAVFGMLAGGAAQADWLSWRGERKSGVGGKGGRSGCGRRRENKNSR